MGAQKKIRDSEDKRPHLNIWEENQDKKEIEKIKEKINHDVKDEKKIKKVVKILEDWLKADN